MIHAVLSGSPWAMLAGIALVAFGLAAILLLRREHRTATWDDEQVEAAMRRHPAGRHLHAPQPDVTVVMPRLDDRTVVMPRYADVTELIPRPRTSSENNRA